VATCVVRCSYVCSALWLCEYVRCSYVCSALWLCEYVRCGYVECVVVEERLQDENEKGKRGRMGVWLRVWCVVVTLCVYVCSALWSCVCGALWLRVWCVVVTCVVRCGRV